MMMEEMDQQDALIKQLATGGIQDEFGDMLKLSSFFLGNKFPFWFRSC